jgi:hypothetical protein
MPAWSHEASADRARISAGGCVEKNASGRLGTEEPADENHRPPRAKDHAPTLEIFVTDKTFRFGPYHDSAILRWRMQQMAQLWRSRVFCVQWLLHPCPKIIRHFQLRLVKEKTLRYRPDYKRSAQCHFWSDSCRRAPTKHCGRPPATTLLSCLSRIVIRLWQ